MAAIGPGQLIEKLERKAAKGIYDILGARPSSKPYISGDSFRALSRHRLEVGGGMDPRSVERGDVIFVETHELRRFRAEFLPLIRREFVLVTHNSDANIGQDESSLADDERILRWFAQNACHPHAKIVPIPIGLENRRYHNNGAVGDYDRLRRIDPEKRPRILFAFNAGTNESERKPALEALRMSTCADERSWASASAYRRGLIEYEFVASPPGNGLDCHRTWEALYLRVIPVVKRSTLYSSWRGLPIIMVDDWNEVLGWSAEYLERRYADESGKFEHTPVLWMDYWERAIRVAR